MFLFTYIRETSNKELKGVQVSDSFFLFYMVGQLDINQIRDSVYLHGDQFFLFKFSQISTVDAFQGGEKDVIILSCVRTQHVGFIDCKR